MLLQGVQILLSISSSPCSKQLGKDAHNDFHLQTLQQACTLQKAQSSALLSLLCITAVVVLLLLAPQWVLILIIAVLMFCICFISR